MTYYDHTTGYFWNNIFRTTFLNIGWEGLTSLYWNVFFLCQGRISLCGQEERCNLGREEFLEALLVLYQECTSPHLMKMQHVANFVHKCKHNLILCIIIHYV